MRGLRIIPSDEFIAGHASVDVIDASLGQVNRECVTAILSAVLIIPKTRPGITQRDQENCENRAHFSMLCDHFRLRDLEGQGMAERTYDYFPLIDSSLRK